MKFYRDSLLRYIRFNMALCNIIFSRLRQDYGRLNFISRKPGAVESVFGWILIFFFLSCQKEFGYIAFRTNLILQRPRRTDQHFA